jgi:hypothetical protein
VRTYYQLLGRPLRDSSPDYRGVYRHGPTYQEHLPEAAAANCAWQEYVAASEELPSQQQALRLAELFRQAGQPFEVVQVEVAMEEPAHDLPGQLGFDICQNRWYSLLSCGLHWKGTVSLSPSPVRLLIRLVESHFRPLLNENGLFSRWSDAGSFLDVVEAIAELAPGTWEAPGYEQFQILRLVEIR